MVNALVALAAVLALLGVASNLVGRWQRHRALGRVPIPDRVRVGRDITIRVHLTGVPSFAGLDPERLNILRGDIVLGRDRLVLASGRGILADLGAEHGRRFTSARCTGPERLVLEGDVPRADGALGYYRFELVVEGAEAWAEALAPFVRDSEDGARYAIRPPG
jgi:hypothetical protein